MHKSSQSPLSGSALIDLFVRSKEKGIVPDEIELSFLSSMCDDLVTHLLGSEMFPNITFACKQTKQSILSQREW